MVGLQTVKVHKDELLDKLKENLENHRTTFEKALEGYQREFLSELRWRVSQLEKGKIPNRLISLPEPEDHTEDYQRIIMMVEMSVDDELELTAQEFSHYVRDDWGWKQAFTATSTRYGAQ